MSNAASEGYFHIFILVYHLQHGYDFWMMLLHSCIWMNVGKMHPPRLTVGPSALKLKCTLHRMNMGDEHHWWCQIISFYKLIWQAKRNLWRRNLSLQWLAFYCKVWDACPDDLAVPWRLMTTYTCGVMFQLEASPWLVDHLDGCWHDAHNQSEDNSQKNPKEIKSFMMNQATPHLGALSSLINNESSNRRRQPEMGTTLTFEWKANTRMSQYMGRAKKALVSK
jgi:hypothetical protein